MLTPKEKAEQIIDRIVTHPLLFQLPDNDDAKIYASFVIEEILKVIDDYNNSELCHQTLLQVANDRYYWTEVKAEIEKL